MTNKMIPDVFDVASYILKKKGDMTSMKLQKLVYYSQAWSLVWDGAPLFNEPFEAWSNGLVCRKLFDKHRGNYMVSAEDIDGDTSVLNLNQKETIDAVIRDYGDKTPLQLRTLTHQEAPWIDARKRLKEEERRENTISHDAMLGYYTNEYDKLSF